jgi:hypothetical protein
MLEFSQIMWRRSSPNVAGAFGTKEFFNVCGSNNATKALLFQYHVFLVALHLVSTFSLKRAVGVSLCFFTSP